MKGPEPLLEVRDLKVHFPVRPSLFRPIRDYVKAVDGVSFQMEAGETLGVVGESGCGKTSLGRALAGLTMPTAGTILFEGRDISAVKAGDPGVRGRNLQIIFQDPYSSLDPRMTVGEIITEGLEIHGLVISRSARRARAKDLLRSVGLDGETADRYPHEFSGGQRQRIGIARALALEPKLIICDEPVSALDVSVRAQVVNLLQDLQQERGLAYLFIAHDLAVVEHISRRIMVMYLGKVVETGTAESVITAPQHPYTRALISAIPVLDPAHRRPRIVPGGDVPSPIQVPPGCPFHPRCPHAEARCREEIPVLRPVSSKQAAACHLAGRLPS